MGLPVPFKEVSQVPKKKARIKTEAASLDSGFLVP